jgi:hypothetical protein
VQGNGRATWLRMLPAHGRPAEGETGYRIFDSMDRPCGRIATCATDLNSNLDKLTNDAEEANSRLTYAIGLIQHDGSVTFDC